MKNKLSISIEVVSNYLWFFFQFFAIPEQHFNMADQLVRENNYPYEVMPVMYALCNSCNDIQSVVKFLDEGKVTFEEFRTRKRLENLDLPSPASGNKNGNVEKSREVIF